MTEADIEFVQSELDVEIPKFYRDFLLAYPDELRAPGCHAWQVEILDVAERIVELNREVRMSHAIDWDDEYFVIGESGCGDYYAIDIDDVESPVYFWNHDFGDFDEREESNSLEHRVEQTMHAYEYVRQLKRPWWKFW
ncbi:SMI1/KNR4 family protein [Pirellulales bacterium]|nr:SMI1/KNR4 family protein [Pirellulales bacterium]